MEIFFTLLVVEIALFFTILFSIKNAVDKVPNYLKRNITIKLNFEKVNKDKKSQL